MACMRRYRHERKNPTTTTKNNGFPTSPLSLEKCLFNHCKLWRDLYIYILYILYVCSVRNMIRMARWYTDIPWLISSQYDGYGGCWWPGAYVAPGHLQPSWLRKAVAVRCVSGMPQHTWTNVGLSSVIGVRKMSLTYTLVKLLPHLPGANELKLGVRKIIWKWDS